MLILKTMIDDVNYPKQKDINNFELLLSDIRYKYFTLIKNSTNILNIKTFKSYDRLIIYLICKIFGLKYDTLKENITLNVSRNRNWTLDYAIKNRIDLDSDDFVTIIRCQKIGVRIYTY